MVVGVVLLCLAAALVMVVRKYKGVRVKNGGVPFLPLLIPALAAMVLGCLFVAGVFTADGHHNPASAQTPPRGGSSGPTTTTLPPGTLSQEVIDALTVSTTNVDCPSLVKASGGTVTSNPVVVKYDIGALKGVPPRLWSDALSTPLPGSDTAQKFKALQTSICEDPLNGATWANLFGDYQVDGIAVRSLNPWLNTFLASASQINTQAQQYVVPVDVSSSQAQLAAAVKANGNWQQFAAKLDTLLSRFQLSGTGAPMSVKNWHLAGDGLQVPDAGHLPSVEVNPRQENLPALVMSVTVKGCTSALGSIGANLQDQRPEEFAPGTCVPPAPPAPPTTQKPSGPPPSHHGTTLPPHQNTTVPPSHQTTPTTRPPSTTTPTTPTTTCRKCNVPPTVAPPPTTVRPTTTTTYPVSMTTTQPGGNTGTTAPPTTSPPGTLSTSTTLNQGVGGH